MAFTYLPDSPNMATFLRSQLRLLVGDTVENDGPRPFKGNYSDSELDALMRLEAADLNRSAARVLEILSAEWSRLAGTYRLGPESEESRQAAEFAARAAVLREQHGFTTTADLDGTGAASGIVDWTAAYVNWIGRF